VEPVAVPQLCLSVCTCNIHIGRMINEKETERICQEVSIMQLKVFLWCLVGQVKNPMRNLEISGVQWFALSSMKCVEVMDKITKHQAPIYIIHIV
jgi:hypothetical protein